MAQSPPSRRRPYQTSRRHPRTYILASSDSSPRDTRLRIFSRLSNRSFYSGTPYLHRHPTPTSDSRSSPRLTYPAIFSRLSTAILTFLQAVEPNLQRHPNVNIGFTFLSSPYISHHLVPSFYRHFKFSRSGGALPPTSPLHQHQVPIPLLAFSTPPSFPVFLPTF